MAPYQRYTALLTSTEEYDGELTTGLPVADYEPVGGMHMFQLPNETSGSLGTSVVEEATPIEG